MTKVSVLGPRALLPDVLERLQQAGVLHVRAEPVGMETLGATSRPIVGDQVAREERLAERARRARDALALLPAPNAARREGDAAADEERAPELDARELEPWLDSARARIEAVANRRATLEDERNTVEHFGRLLEALAPLLAGQIPEMKRVETIGLLVKRDADLPKLLRTELPRLTGGAHTLLSRDHEGDIALLIIVPGECAGAVDRLLAGRGVAEIRTFGHVETPAAREPSSSNERTYAESLSWLLRRRRDLPRDILESDQERAALGRRLRRPLTHVLRGAEDQLARLRSMGHCGETHHVFILSGFVPRERAPALGEELAKTTDGSATLIENPIEEEDFDEVPVLLHNPRLIRPFELLLRLLPAPRYGTVDPTPLLAGSFPVIYGMMLGDAGYGAIVLALALALWKRRTFGEAGSQAAFIGIGCGVAGICFGVLFGEFFGELGRSIGLRPVLVSRAEPRVLLGLVLSVGALHVALGVCLRLRMAIRRRAARAIIASATKLAVLASAAVVALSRFGYLGSQVGSIALVLLAPLALVLVIVEGLLSPLEIVKMLGHVLSYARLMAIGMASVMLADVANRMTTLLQPLALGIAAALLLHVVNLVLGIVGPAIQATRLHLVEFFDKFYEPGGRPYAPLATSR